MVESNEGSHVVSNPTRTALLIALMNILPASAVADMPECHDIKSKPVPTESVRLEGNEEAEVVCVVDGDTFDVRIKDGRVLRIRLWGVDCPESRENRKCLRNGESACRAEVQRGKKAKELTKSLLDGKKVILQPKYSNVKNRKQAYVVVSGRDLGKALIGSCQCHEAYSHQRKEEYERAAKACGK
jgi:endonuclease YncB( thermonuclease family)